MTNINNSSNTNDMNMQQSNHGKHRNLTSDLRQYRSYIDFKYLFIFALIGTEQNSDINNQTISSNYPSVRAQQPTGNNKNILLKKNVMFIFVYKARSQVATDMQFTDVDEHTSMCYSKKKPSLYLCISRSRHRSGHCE
jgi:hypothetical protein